MNDKGLIVTITNSFKSWDIDNPNYDSLHDLLTQDNDFIKNDIALDVFIKDLAEKILING